MSKETKMDKITLEMMEHVCDQICKWPNMCIEDELVDRCYYCKMRKFVCDILNTYTEMKNKEQFTFTLNADEENTISKELVEMCEEVKKKEEEKHE